MTLDSLNQNAVMQLRDSRTQLCSSDQKSPGLQRLAANVPTEQSLNGHNVVAAVRAPDALLKVTEPPCHEPPPPESCLRQNGSPLESGWDLGPFPALLAPGHSAPPATKHKETIRD